MQTTTATYSISVTTDEGIATFYKTIPTRPKTSKGVKAQNAKLSKWVEKTTQTSLSTKFFLQTDELHSQTTS